MEFNAMLSGLDRAGQVSAVYLSGRYLTHGLNRDKFLLKLKRDAKANYSEATVRAVFSIIEAIEAREGTPVASLAMAARLDYASDLSALIWDRTEPVDNPERVEQALADLAGS